MAHITGELNEALRQLQEGLRADLATRCQPLQHLISQASLAEAKQDQLNHARDCQECKQKDWQIKLLEDNLADLRRCLRPEHQATEQFDSVENKLLDHLNERAPERVTLKFSEGSDDPDSISYERYADLARLYRDLYNEQRTLISSFSTLKKKLKSSKDKVTAWNRYFERDSFDVNVGGKKVVFRRADVPSTGSRIKVPQLPLSDKQSSDDNLNTLHVLPNERVDSTSNGDRWLRTPLFPPVVASETALGNGEMEQPMEDVHPETHNSDDPGPTQSQCFEDDAATQALPSESSSDTPTVVAARPVRKTRRSVLDNHTSARYPHTENRVNAVTVKKEPALDSSVVFLEPSIPENGSRPTVPDNTAQPAEAGDDCHAMPPTLNSVLSTQSDGDEPNSNPSTALQQTDQKDKPQATGTKRAALQPMDTNARLNQRTGMGAKRRKTGNRGEKAIPTVAEDGEEEYGSQRRVRQQADPGSSDNITPKRRPGHNRLEDLLGSAPGPRPVLASPSPRTPGARTPLNRQNRTNDKPNGPLVSHVQQPGPSTLNLNTAETQSPDDDEEILPDDEPYRARPLNRLSLDHFRLNPARNQGLSHAFDEVVRRKSERKCLSGCVLPNCCGPKFRALAELRMVGITTDHRDVTVDSMNAEDRQVLEEYLGNNRNVLETISEDEFRELLLEAWTRRLANQHGRHRHVHDRARSPPGFWRTDMPSTQELERDREEARKAEREKVAERYREAMKPDGLWMFADE